MSREIRVRLRKDIAVCDGQTSTVVFAGTEGTALSVNSPEDRLRDKPRTIAVSWDAALLNEEDDPTCVTTGWEAAAVAIEDVEYIGLIERPE